MRSRPEPLSRYDWFERRVRKAIDLLMASLDTKIEAQQWKEQIRLLKGVAEFLDDNKAFHTLEHHMDNPCESAVEEISKAFSNAPRSATVKEKRIFDYAEVKLAQHAASLLRRYRGVEQANLQEVAFRILKLIDTQNFKPIHHVWVECEQLGKKVDSSDENLFVFDAMSELYFECIVDFLMAPDWMVEKIQKQLHSLPTEGEPAETRKKKDDLSESGKSPARQDDSESQTYIKVEFAPQPDDARDKEIDPVGKKVDDGNDSDQEPVKKTFIIDDSKIDHSIVAVFFEEANEIADELKEIMSSSGSIDGLSTLLRHLHTLKGGSRMVGLNSLGDYIHEVEQTIEPVKSDHSLLNECNWSTIQELWEEISDIISVLKQGNFKLDLSEPFARCKGVSLQGNEIINSVEIGPVSTDSDISTLIDPVTDREIVSVFLEEAGELLPEIDVELKKLEKNHHDMDAVDSIKRHLHTLKGGARMVGQKKLGQFIHDTEDMYQESMQDKQIPKKLLEQLMSRQAIMIDATAVLGQAKTTSNGHEPSDTPTHSLNAAPVASVDKSRQSIRVNMQDLNRFMRLISTATVARTQVESDILDIENLVNIHGQSINNVLEKIKGVEESSSSNSKGVKAENLLPVIKKSLSRNQKHNERVRELLYSAQGLLFEARHAVVELQKGLINVQLVPFESIQPRLQTMVGQLCEELGKRIVFRTDLQGEEIDRQTLERLIPVFEHMLRNSIDHGVDTPENRIKNGKDPTGTITLSVKRSGTDTMISFSDDGRGINVDGIRTKAVSKGFLSEDAKLSDQELLRFILQPGFSTTSAVTKISGRGVGMDVVNSEIEKLGGTLLINTSKGEGTVFTIVLPFTQSLNEVLLLTIQNQWYALPTHAVEGIVRVPYKNVIQHLEEGTDIQVNKLPYHMRYLGNLLHQNPMPSSLFDKKAMPVILLKVTDTPLALLVDHVIGARKVMTKSPGPQLSRLKQYAGSCIMPNGRAVMILDAVDLEHTVLSEQKQNPLEQQEGAPTILVVDDSSTARKMAKKVLEMHHLKVITANDGEEALKLMQKTTPDMVLLDVDMPKMNGYQVVENMKKHKALKNIPVVIISSRSSKEHKEKTKALKVQATLEKPFKPDELIKLINMHVVGEKNA